MSAVRSSRYEARGKFGEHARCVRVARGVAEPIVNLYMEFSRSTFTCVGEQERHYERTKRTTLVLSRK